MAVLKKILDSLDGASSSRSTSIEGLSDIQFSKSPKLNKLAQMIAGDMAAKYNSTEELVSELERYKSNFRREPDYNWVQYGNFPVVSYPDAVAYLKDAGFAEPRSAEGAWEKVKAVTGLVIDTILKEFSKIEDSQDDAPKTNWADLDYLPTSTPLNNFAKKIAFDLQGWKDREEVIEFLNKSRREGGDTFGELILEETSLPFSKEEVQQKYADSAGLHYAASRSSRDFTATILEVVVDRILEAEDDLEPNRRIYDDIYSADEEVTYGQLVEDIGASSVLDELEQWLSSRDLKEFVEDYLTSADLEEEHSDVNTLRSLRELVGSDEDISNELEQWLPSGELREFVDDYIRLYDLREEEEEPMTWEALIGDKVISNSTIVGAISTVLGYDKKGSEFMKKLVERYTDGSGNYQGYTDIEELVEAGVVTKEQVIELFDKEYKDEFEEEVLEEIFG